MSGRGRGGIQEFLAGNKYIEKKKAAVYICICVYAYLNAYFFVMFVLLYFFCGEGRNEWVVHGT